MSTTLHNMMDYFMSIMLVLAMNIFELLPVQPHGNSVNDGSSLQCSSEWVDKGCFSHSQLLCKDC